MKSFLTGLAHTTKALESNRNTLDEVLPALDFILKLYEDGKAQYKDDPVMSTCINSGWAKLDKYYSLTSETPAYVGAQCSALNSVAVSPYYTVFRTVIRYGELLINRIRYGESTGRIPYTV